MKNKIILSIILKLILMHPSVQCMFSIDFASKQELAKKYSFDLGIDLVKSKSPLHDIAGKATLCDGELQLQAFKDFVELNYQDINALSEEIYSIESNIFSNTKPKRTPLQIAIRTGKKHIIEYIVKSRIELDTKDPDGNTVAHLAAKYTRAEILSYLLQNGADVNAKNYNGQTPLHVMVENSLYFGFTQYKDTLICLLQNGADIEAVDNQGNTVFDLDKDLFFIEDADLSIMETLKTVQKLHEKTDESIAILNSLLEYIKNGKHAKTEKERCQILLRDKKAQLESMAELVKKIMQNEMVPAIDKHKLFVPLTKFANKIKHFLKLDEMLSFFSCIPFNKNLLENELLSIVLKNDNKKMKLRDLNGSTIERALCAHYKSIPTVFTHSKCLYGDQKLLKKILGTNYNQKKCNYNYIQKFILASVEMAKKKDLNNAYLRFFHAANFCSLYAKKLTEQEIKRGLTLLKEEKVNFDIPKIPSIQPDIQQSKKRLFSNISTTPEQSPRKKRKIEKQ